MEETDPDRQISGFAYVVAWGAGVGKLIYLSLYIGDSTYFDCAIDWRRPTTNRRLCGGLEPLLFCRCTVLAYCRADIARSFSDLTGNLFPLRGQGSEQVERFDRCM